MTDDEIAEIVQKFTVAFASRKRDGESVDTGTGPLNVEARYCGRLCQSVWVAPSPSLAESLAEALSLLRARIERTSVNELLICVGGESSECQLGSSGDWARINDNDRQGMVGYELRGSGHSASVSTRISPFELVAENRSFEKKFASFAIEYGLSVNEARKVLRVFEFPTDQFRVELTNPINIVPLYRGMPLVGLSEITRDSVSLLLERMTDFLVRSVKPDGRMVYVYYPSRGEEDRSRDNSIRQWMATRALVHVSRTFNQKKLEEVVQRNIRFNISKMYLEEGNLGFIVEGEKIKLGAVALAALALSNSIYKDEFQSVVRKLCNTVRFMWKNSGRFRTFLLPPDRDDCHNFYSGEALLLWANLLHDDLSDDLVACFYQSFQYYMPWHRRNRNPAFVPWHTMAYAKIWDRTHEPQLLAAIFEMNDWLLGVQQWEELEYEDCKGRFYSPTEPYGPPHASSTAVYLEGLGEALRLARSIGDFDRVNSYRVAILRGLRSLMQLTYKSSLDFSFISKRESLLGGVRTSEYNNIVRIDNVQHSIMALLTTLDVFSADDWSASSVQEELTSGNCRKNSEPHHLSLQGTTSVSKQVENVAISSLDPDSLLFGRVRGFSVNIEELVAYYNGVISKAESVPYFDNGSGYEGWSITSRDGTISDGVRRLEMNRENMQSVRQSSYETELCGGIVKDALGQLSDLTLEPMRVRVMRLKNEGREMTFHRDAKTACWRIHIPIVTNPNSFFEWKLASGEIRRVHLPADGSAWFVRVDTLHRAVNVSEFSADRVHMIMSLGASPNLEIFEDHSDSTLLAHAQELNEPIPIAPKVSQPEAKDFRNIDWSQVKAEDRLQLLQYLPKRGTGCEIGVFKGSFSRQLVDVLQPRKLHLVDPWTPQDIRLWQKKSQEFHWNCMREVQSKLAKEIANHQVIIHQAFSVDILALFPTHYLDWIYLDGDHRYETVRLELELAHTRVKPNGLIMGHDFIKPEIYPPERRSDFQVVQAVYDFCTVYPWDLVFQTPDQLPGSQACPSFVLRRRPE
jgi:hypothetical protein